MKSTTGSKKGQIIFPRKTNGIQNTFEEQLRSPIYSPYHAEDISRLPKTTILIGEFDGMRSDSEAYFKKLKKHGCRVSKKMLPGQCHHTLLLRGVMNEAEDPAKDIAELLRNH